MRYKPHLFRFNGQWVCWLLHVPLAKPGVCHTPTSAYQMMCLNNGFAMV